MEFIEVYKRRRHFMKIKHYFIKKYPQYQPFLQGNGLRNRFNQILRAALRKVKQIISNTAGAIELVKLDDDRIKYVMKSSRSLKARLMLVDIYQDTSQAYTSRIEAVAQELNEAIADKSKYKFKEWAKLE
jgi:hypothetical protein